MYDSIVKVTGEKCPNDGASLLRDGDGHEWCSKVGCLYKLEVGVPLDQMELTPEMKYSKNRDALVKDIAKVLNTHSMENRSNTPDFILAEHLVGCLEVFDKATNRRSEWYNPKEEEKAS